MQGPLFGRALLTEQTPLEAFGLNAAPIIVQILGWRSGWRYENRNCAPETLSILIIGDDGRHRFGISLKIPYTA